MWSEKHVQLCLEDVSIRLGGIQVLRDITLTVPEGCITAFIGPNGAGKTTLLHTIAGVLKPDNGSIRFRDRDITGLAPHRVARRGIGRQFQDVRIFGGLTVLDNVLVCLLPHAERDVWKGWAPARRNRRGEDDAMGNAMEWLEHVGLADRADDTARELSFGQQKLLSLARLFAQRFPFLLLDEPTAGVSPVMVGKISELIQEAVSARGTTIALVEHNMGVVENLAHGIHFLHEGSVAYSGDRKEVLGNPKVRELYMGVST